MFVTITLASNPTPDSNVPENFKPSVLRKKLGCTLVLVKLYVYKLGSTGKYRERTHVHTHSTHTVRSVRTHVHNIVRTHVRIVRTRMCVHYETFFFMNFKTELFFRNSTENFLNWEYYDLKKNVFFFNLHTA